MREREATTGRGRGKWVLVVLLVAAVAAVAVFRGINMISWPPNPFEKKTNDRSGPVLVQSIQDLSRYEAASGTFQVVIDLAHDAKFLPDSVLGDRTLFVATGSVDAYIDFSKIGKGAVTVNSAHTVATIKLPHAALEKANLDEKNSHVVAQQRGLLDRFKSFLGGDSDQQHQLWVLAASKIGTAAKDSKLATQAEHNTKIMLTGMLRSLGYTTVNVTFANPT